MSENKTEYKSELFDEGFPASQTQSESSDRKGGEPNEKPSNKRPKRNIIMTFLLSLLASLVMWLVAVDSEGTDYEKSFTNIDIKLVGAEQTEMQIELVGNVRLDITVSGKRSILSTLKSSSFTALVDVSAIDKEGKSDPLPVEIEAVNGVTVLSQSMTHLTVNAEKRVTDTFEIIPLLGTAQLEHGVEFSLVCDTLTVSVTGSESHIRNIKRAVAYVNPEPKNVTKSFKSNCRIILESDVELDETELTVYPQYCGVEVTLKKEKSVPVQIKLDGGADIQYGTSFHPDVSSILVFGEPENVDRVESIYLSIPYEKITNQLGSGKKSFTIKGTLEYPEKITAVGGETEIEVTVDVSQRFETVQGENVVISGCPLGYTVKVSDVEIELTGLYEEIETIKSSAITVSLDLSEVAPSEREQKVKGTVAIEKPYGTIYKSGCLVSVVFSKTA